MTTDLDRPLFHVLTETVTCAGCGLDVSPVDQEEVFDFKGLYFCTRLCIALWQLERREKSNV